MPLTRLCPLSGIQFIITDEDLKFYEKMGVPPPTLCPEERQRRRLAWRNERTLYTRKCDGSGNHFISIYHADTDSPVYKPSHWWSDQWEALDYGRDFDFKQSFFEQFKTLQTLVPKIGIMNDNDVQSENCAYCQDFTFGKNCYLMSTVWYAEDCAYVSGANHIKDVYDSSFIGSSELAYQCINVEHLYNCCFVRFSSNCSDCFLGVDLQGCKDCFGCIGLRNKQYHIANKAYSKEDYIQTIQKIKAKTYKELQKQIQDFETSIQKVPRKNKYEWNCEDCEGDFLYNCKNVSVGFDLFKAEDCKYYYGHADTVKNSYDITIGGKHEWAYECLVPDNSYMELFSLFCWESQNTYYSDNCHSCSDIFGCIGLKHKKNCILNKSYPQHEYDQLKSRIIEHMKETGEWGEFFPISISPFTYNESVAQQYFPLTKEEALTRGYRWRDEGAFSKYIGEPCIIPDAITEIPDNICEKILTCEQSGKNYKIQKAELKFYKKMGLPIPRLHPDVRHQERINLRNPRHLYDRTCAECQKAIQTTYSPDRPEKVLCEECYLKVLN